MFLKRIANSTTKVLKVPKNEKKTLSYFHFCFSYPQKTKVKQKNIHSQIFIYSWFWQGKFLIFHLLWWDFIISKDKKKSLRELNSRKQQLFLYYPESIAFKNLKRIKKWMNSWIENKSRVCNLKWKLNFSLSGGIRNEKNISESNNILHKNAFISFEFVSLVHP